MKILFVIKNFYPYDDASSNCISNIAKYLMENKVKVDVLSMKFNLDIKDKEIYNGIKIYRVLDLIETHIEEIIERINKENKSYLLRNIKKIKIIIIKALRRLEYKFDKNTIAYYEKRITIKKIRELNKKKKYDCIISVSQPFYTSVAVRKALRKNKNTKFLVYQLDPYSNNISEKIEYKDLKMKIEKKVFERADNIIVTDLIYEEDKNCELKNYCNKMSILKFPVIEKKYIKKCNDDIELDKEYINCVFAGHLYENIRDPRYVLELFSKLKNKKIRLVIIGTGMRDLLNKYKDKLGESLVIYDKVSKEAAFNAMINANILVNIGNNISNQMPSKILDYISTGKPILNFYKISNCPTLEYTKDYQLAFDINENNKINNKLINEFGKFCVDNKYQYIAFEKIKQIYKECTPGFVGNQFINIIRGVGMN